MLSFHSTRFSLSSSYNTLMTKAQLLQTNKHDAISNTFNACPHFAHASHRNHFAKCTLYLQVPCEWRLKNESNRGSREHCHLNQTSGPFPLAFWLCEGEKEKSSECSRDERAIKSFTIFIPCAQSDSGATIARLFEVQQSPDVGPHTKQRRGQSCAV